MPNRLKTTFWVAMAWACSTLVGAVNASASENKIGCVELVSEFEFCAPDESWQITPVAGLAGGFRIEFGDAHRDASSLIAFSCDTDLANLRGEAKERTVKEKLLEMSYSDISGEKRTHHLHQNNPAISFSADESKGLVNQTVVYVDGCFQLALTIQKKGSPNLDGKVDRGLHQRVVDAIVSGNPRE